MSTTRPLAKTEKPLLSARRALSAIKPLREDWALVHEPTGSRMCFRASNATYYLAIVDGDRRLVEEAIPVEIATIGPTEYAYTRAWTRFVFKAPRTGDYAFGWSIETPEELAEAIAENPYDGLAETEHVFAVRIVAELVADYLDRELTNSLADEQKIVATLKTIITDGKRESVTEPLLTTLAESFELGTRDALEAFFLSAISEVREAGY